MPTQVLVSVTPAAKAFLETCKVPDAAKLAGELSIDLDELYRLADEHARLGGEPVRIHELMEGSEVVGRRAAQEPEMTELERMRLESQERSYQRMVQGVTPMNAKKRKEHSEQMAGFQWATNFGTQVLVAFVGAFLLGYYFVETFVAPDSMSIKVVAGAACSFATLLLETCLLVVHDSKEQMIERKLQEAASRQKQQARKKQDIVSTEASSAAGAVNSCDASVDPGVSAEPSKATPKSTAPDAPEHKTAFAKKTD